jgi:A/G-specific adenine glycosylase
VVRQWSGLGYNRRAVDLHRAAEAIVDRHDGRVPNELGSLLALPGVGAYTARAVLVFAFERDVGVVDTNVARLLARAVTGRPLGAADAQRLADRLVPDGQGWAFTQAMFDLGARHCTRQRPDCGPCPLRRRCRWWAEARLPPNGAHPAPGADSVLAPGSGVDPALGPTGARRAQQRFEGSDRQGRGRLVEAMRCGPIAPGSLARAAGWPDDQGRASAAAEALVGEGLACWLSGGQLALA